MDKKFKQCIRFQGLATAERTLDETTAVAYVPTTQAAVLQALEVGESFRDMRGDYWERIA